MNKDKLGKALAAGAGAAAAAAVAATTVAATKKMRRQQEEEIENAVQNRDYGDKQVYFVGGGIASLAGAAYLVRDANFKGKNIHILEGMDILGGSNDGDVYKRQLLSTISKVYHKNKEKQKLAYTTGLKTKIRVYYYCIPLTYISPKFSLYLLLLISPAPPSRGYFRLMYSSRI